MIKSAFIDERRPKRYGSWRRTRSIAVYQSDSSKNSINHWPSYLLDSQAWQNLVSLCP